MEPILPHVSRRWKTPYTKRFYDCIVLTRNRGISLATEQRIEELTAFHRLREDHATVRHADYVIAIRSEIGTGQPDTRETMKGGA